MQMNAAIAAAILAFTSSVLAYHPSQEYGSALYARDAYAGAYDDHDLYARDAYADADAYPEADAYADAYPEAYADAYPDADAEAEAYDDADDFDLHARDEEFNIHPRDAYMEGYKHGLYARSFDYDDDFEGLSARAAPLSALEKSSSKSSSSSKSADPKTSDDWAEKSTNLKAQKAAEEKMLNKDKTELAALLQKTRTQQAKLTKTVRASKAADKSGVDALMKEYETMLAHKAAAKQALLKKGGDPKKGKLPPKDKLTEKERKELAALNKKGGTTSSTDKSGKTTGSTDGTSGSGSSKQQKASSKLRFI